MAASEVSVAKVNVDRALTRPKVNPPRYYRYADYSPWRWMMFWRVPYQPRLRCVAPPLQLLVQYEY